MAEPRLAMAMSVFANIGVLAGASTRSGMGLGEKWGHSQVRPLN